MIHQGVSPSNRFYCVGLLPPEEVNATAMRLRQSHVAMGEIPAPLAPIIPLQYYAHRPSPPVPGRLPLCSHPIVPGEYLELNPDAHWVIWPVYSGNWFCEMQEALSGTANSCLPAYLFPLKQGIPIGTEKSHNFLEAIAEHRWRALNLVCYGVRFITERRWYLSLYWHQEWQRRLRRAPANSG